MCMSVWGCAYVCVRACMSVVSWYACNMCVCVIKEVWMCAILRATIARPGISILTFRSQ